MSNFSLTIEASIAGHLAGRVGLRVGTTLHAPTDGAASELAALLDSYPGASWVQPEMSMSGWGEVLAQAAGDRPIIEKRRALEVAKASPWASWLILVLPSSWAGVPLAQIAAAFGAKGIPPVAPAEVWLTVDDERAPTITPRWLESIAAAMSWSGDQPIGTMFARGGAGLARCGQAASQAMGAWRVEVSP